MACTLLERGPRRGEVGHKLALLEQHGGEAVGVFAGELQQVVRLAAPGSIVVEDAIDGIKPKRIRESLDRLEARGAHIRSTAQVLSSVGAVVTGLGAGDSTLHTGLLVDSAWQSELGQMRDEVAWLDLMHRGGVVPRKVAVQAWLDEGEPLYRHPVDAHPETVPFTPFAERLRLLAQQRLSVHLNHALIQQYRDGNANISLHADKTLDVARGSAVLNISLGATRTMVLRPKGGGEAQRIDLPHGSIFVMGWDTNRHFQHGIHPDRRTEREKRRDERRTERISLTFRTVATFRKGGLLVGQGAGPRTDRQGMLAAFGQENRDPYFDWDAWYGEGWSIA